MIPPMILPALLRLVSTLQGGECREETDLMREWFGLMHQKNGLARWEQELSIRARELELEDRDARLQLQLQGEWWGWTWTHLFSCSSRVSGEGVERSTGTHGFSCSSRVSGGVVVEVWNVRLRWYIYNSYLYKNATDTGISFPWK